MEDNAISADGIPISFETRGDGAPALVFVHGWSCDRTYWRHQLGHFADRYQVVAIDLPGHGKSGDGRRTWTMPAFGRDVVAVAERLGLRRMVLIGHSMGGDVIVEAAGHLRGRVAVLVWVDVYRTLGEPRSQDEVERLAAPLRADFVSATRAFARQMFLPTSDENLANWVVDDMSAAPPNIALSALEHAVSFEPAVVRALPGLGTPVVAINPDPTPRDVQALERHGIKTVVMSGVGHFAMMEDPSTFNRLLTETVEKFAAT